MVDGLCKVKINFDLKEIRKHGIEILFSLLFVVLQVTNNGGDLRRCRMSRRARTEVRSGHGKLRDYG